MSSAGGEQLLARLLADPGFRARFRSDPAQAARQAGLDELAAELETDRGKPFETLEIRESRSSLAGVMLAGAVEGIGLFALAEHGPQLGAEEAMAAGTRAAPQTDDGPPAPVEQPDAVAAERDDDPASDADHAGDSASSVDEAGGPTGDADDAGDPATPAQAAGEPADDADDAGDPATPVQVAGGPLGDADDADDEDEPDEEEPDEEEPDEEEPDEEEPDEEEPDEEEPDENEDDEDESDNPEAADGDSDAPEADGEPGDPEADGDSDSAADDSGDSETDDSGDSETDDSGDTEASGSETGESGDSETGEGDDDGDGDDDDAAGVGSPNEQAIADWKPHPEQYGMAGGGGAGSPIDVAVLKSAHITLDANGKQDFAKGRMDPRVGTLLLRLAERHKITLSATTSDHPQSTAGGSPSNHWYGRAVDIATVDGEIVRPNSAAARKLATELTMLDPSFRPDEVGSPWAIGAAGFFSDADHQDHIHVAFDQAISRSWKASNETRVMRAIRPAGGR